MAVMNVQDVMTRDVTSIVADLKIDVALQTMLEHGVRRLPVLGEEDRLIGIITQMQAQLALPRGSDYYSSSTQDEVPLVGDVMTVNVFTIGPGESVLRAARLMLGHGIGALPVVEDRKVVGIVTESDLFETLVDLLEKAPTA